MRFRRYLRNRAIRWSRRVASPVQRWRDRRSASTMPLEPVRRRLELTLAAMYGLPIRIGAAGATAEADVILPQRLALHGDPAEALARFRALALAQTARLARGTGTSAPADLLEHDLYLVAESVAAELDVVTRVPKLTPTLQALRFGELSARPKIFRLAAVERQVEGRLSTVLATPPDRVPDAVPLCATPAESLAWARATAAEIRRTNGDRPGYRPLNPMTLWGLAWSARAPSSDVDLGGGGGGSKPDPYSTSRTEDDSGARRGQSDSAERGEQSAGDDSATEEADAEGESAEGGAAPSERSSATRDRETEAADPEIAQRRPAADRPPPNGIPYPEWDEYAHRLREHGATVSVAIAESGDAAWADDVLREHAPLVREVRDRFAPLRAHRQRLRRQRTGDELDLEACVDALVDRRMGRVPSERLYQVVRPARQTVAIALLVDASGSTAMRLADGRTVLDVERMTLLLAGEALATLGDPFAMLAFSGAGRHGVRVRTVKAFEDRDAAAPRRRIAALVAEDNTRLGAAVRHATAVLRGQPARRRVLLILSDGQPNDVDLYQGVYAIEDSRRALNDARAEGVVPFCLTVEQDEQDYLPHVFGKTGYRVLRRPEQLPAALLEVVKGILGRA